MQELYNKKQHITGIPTGFADLDYKTAGLHGSDLVLVAARPAMGKSAFALNIATNAAVRAKVPVAIFSLEMSKEQLVNRVLCSEAMVDSITGTFYHNLETYFDETTCPRDYEEYLESLNNSGIADSVENVVSGVTGLISRIISSVVGRIAAIGTFPTIIINIVIVSIIKKKGGGVSNRLG